MGFADDLLTHTATYWGNPQNDGYGGKTFDAPVEVSCFWKDKQQLFVDSNGEQKLSQSIVILSTEVAVGGYLYHGSSEETDPYSVDGAREIRNRDKTPDPDNETDFIVEAFL